MDELRCDSPNASKSPSGLSILLQRNEAGHPDKTAGSQWRGYVPAGEEQSKSPDPTDSVFMNNLRMPLLMFTDDEADTWVYIDPAPQPGQSTLLTAETQTIPHRIHSRSLLKTGSSVFKKYFEPRCQARVRKRRGLADKLPDGIKYVLDLSPATEGDDALIFMTELSCPVGVRKWARYMGKWNLPPSCVGGQDEVEWLPAPERPQKQGAENETQDGSCDKGQASGTLTKPYRMNWDGGLPQPPEQEALNEEDFAKRQIVRDAKPPRKVPGLPLDYSPTRHRTGIERLLHALEGLDPRLDTAPKLWTFFALAKLFHVATVPAVCDYIVSWLLQQPNTLFVEVHPELAYRIACGIQNTDLCREAFAILVGEEALLLLEASVEGCAPKRSQQTFHGRARETLDDTELQRIEYASKTFLERILEAFVSLVGTEMSWVDELVARHVKGGITSENIAPVTELTRILKEWIRCYIYTTLQRQTSTYVDDRRDSLGGNDLDYPSIDFFTAPAGMYFASRVLTRSFWRTLITDSFPQAAMSFPARLLHDSIRDLAPQLPCFKSQADAKIRLVRYEEVAKAVRNFNKQIGFLLRRGENNNNETGDIPSSSSLPLDKAADLYWLEQAFLGIREPEPEPHFYLGSFGKDVQSYIARVAKTMEQPPHPEKAAKEDGVVQFDLVDTLVCLQEEEFKYLPLWASGNDDGTGGVFVDQDIPILETGGFSTPGPAVHTESSVASASSPASDSFSTIHPSDAASTVQRASHRVTHSYKTETDVVSLESASTADTADTETAELWQRVRELDLEEDRDSDSDDDTIGAETQSQLDLDDNDDDDDDDEYYHVGFDDEDTTTNASSSSSSNSSSN